MDFKSLLQSLDQLNEAAKKDAKAKGKAKEEDTSDEDESEDVTEGIMDEPATKDTPTGRIHKAKPGGYGRKDDEDDEGKKVKQAAAPRGRGRPKKNADSETGEVKKYDWSAFGATGKDVKLPKWDKKKTTKHSLKDWFERVDQLMINEAEQIQIKPASQVKQQPGQPPLPGTQQVAGQPMKQTQVIQQGNKVLGSVQNPQLAQQIKQSIGKGEMTLMPDQEQQMAEAGYSAKAARAGKDIGKPGKNFGKIAASAGEKYGSKAAGERVAGAVLAKLRGKTTEGAHTQGYAELNPAPKAPGIGGKIANVAKKIGKAITGPGDDELLGRLEKETGGKRPARQVREGDIAPTSGVDTVGAGLGRGRNPNTLESKKAKPDFLDLDKDGNKKESMKKAAQDKKKTVKEGAEHRMKAAHHAGKSHALSKQGYNCPYEDMEESRMYHEGFKEGLDECYGQMGMMDEASNTVDDMASFGAHTPTLADEGNAFTAGLAKTKAGHSFNLGGKKITDTSGYDANLDEFAQFEGWDNQLNALIEGKQVAEGMSVSISKGQQGTPDSVSVTAQDHDADALLSLIKQAGLGLFGGDEPKASSPMSAQADGEPAEVGAEGPEIDVVDDHDGMLALMKKMTGQGGEEGHDHDEETCDTCGSSDCQCDDGEEEEVVDEVESYDQEEEEVAEENAPDSGAQETTSDENAEASEDSALATADAGQDAEEGEEDAAEEGEEEQVTEWANDAGENSKDFDDEGFQTDMDFMTKVISGGLNKQKETGQTTIPVIAHQGQRTGVNESISDWKKLAGI